MLFRKLMVKCQMILARFAIKNSLLCCITIVLLLRFLRVKLFMYYIEKWSNNIYERINKHLLKLKLLHCRKRYIWTSNEISFSKIYLLYFHREMERQDTNDGKLFNRNFRKLQRFSGSLKWYSNMGSVKIAVKLNSKRAEIVWAIDAKGKVH